MTQSEIEAVLQAAFEQCQAAGYPLGSEQKQILMAIALQQQAAATLTVDTFSNSDTTNPLESLTLEQRQTLLAFVRDQESQGQSWKLRLLEDWVQGQESGEMQFIRDLYGPQWLEQVKPIHLAAYAEDVLLLKPGDRIEVANSLWEWVQEEGPCSREWVFCWVISVSETFDNTPTLPDSYRTYTNCIIRFDNGIEYEIQGIYEWNRYNWRWHGA